MHLLAKHKGTLKCKVAPALDIEVVWQAHLIRTEHYRNYCLHQLDQCSLLPHSNLISALEVCFSSPFRFLLMHG